MVTSTTTGLYLRILCSGKRTLHQQRHRKERNTRTKFEIEHNPLNLINYEKLGETTQKDPNETKEAFKLLIITKTKYYVRKKLRATKEMVKIVRWNGLKLLFNCNVN